MLTRICAIAKDEAPYVADWIFHHLYFGFDQIHVYINRTSDSTALIIDRILDIYPSISYEYIDWVDNCPIDVTKKMQVIAYAKDLEWSKSNGVDWWFCLDIDETWVPKDFDISIKDYLSGKCRENPICFMWHNAFGEIKPFSGVSPDSSYFVGKQVKTISPIQNVEVKRVRVHRHKFEENCICHDADGEPFEFSETNIQVASDQFIGTRNAYIIHQMFRSEPEYLNTLVRGNPEHEFALKNNRPGYKDDLTGKQPKYAWPTENYRNYCMARKQFYYTTGIEALVNKSRDEILAKSDVVKAKIQMMIDSGDKNIASIVDGTSLAF